MRDTRRSPEPGRMLRSGSGPEAEEYEQSPLELDEDCCLPDDRQDHHRAQKQVASDRSSWTTSAGRGLPA
jgi:hypothetical protein